MSALKNTVRLIGRVGRDPSIATVKGEKKIARFTLATSERYTNAKNETIIDTNWHSLVAWGTVADIVTKFVKKGCEVAVEGKLVTRSYVDKQGIKRHATEIHVNEFLLLNKQHS